MAFSPLFSLPWLLIAIAVFSGVIPGGFAYDEAEDERVTVVTNNGVASKAKLHIQDKDDKMVTASDLNEGQLDQNGQASVSQLKRVRRQRPDLSDLSDWTEQTELSRRRRFKSSMWRTWPKAIVPFTIDMNSTGVHYRDEAYAAFTRYHKYTCIRYVPLKKGQMTTLYGLKNDAHMIIEKAKGCVAWVGFLNAVKGQGNSCCGRGACTHELGHTLGLSHEQNSPLRSDMMSIDWRYGSGEALANPTGTIHYHYDFMNPMHYGGRTFKILYEDLRPLWGMSTAWFLYKDVSLMHDCQGLHCSNFTTKCLHDGFVTLVDDKCSCLCAAGLDPVTGCATVIKKVPTSPKWPAGSYALLSSKDGCPGDSGVFSPGTWQHKGKGDNSKSDEFNLGRSYLADNFTHKFCVKSASSGAADSGPKWETGRYCILRVNGKCPDGFKSGWRQFDDADDSPKVRTGSLPDGTFSADTRLEFCCRDDGWLGTPLITVPNDKPLVLFYSPTRRSCQEIEGMRWTKEWMTFDGYPAKANKSEQTPRGSVYTLQYCHYQPVTSNCGGEIHLSRQSPSDVNRHAVIKSPGYPASYGINMECNWLITAPKNGRILLKFQDLKMTQVNGDCQDSLEIRYNMPAQPGVRYCGNGLSRTIRSINNTIILTLRSDHHLVAADTGFSVTASLHIPDEDECYDPATRGSFYRGKMFYTRSMRTCLPWAEVQHCLRDHAFKSSDFGKGLDQNYCRNPDNTAMPWCFTSSECYRDYCDVCNLENVYDRETYCSAKTCEGKTPEQIIAAGCAGTCKLQQPATPVRGASCGTPDDDTVPDASIVPPSVQRTGPYRVGDYVTHKCKTGPESLLRYCMSTGEWTPMGYVCGSCTDGWAYYQGACYKHYEEFKNWDSAKATCGQHPGASLLRVDSVPEQDFASGLRFSNKLQVWLAAKDEKTETVWRWEDGSNVTMNGTWDRDDGKPDWHTRRNCAVMKPDFQRNNWTDVSCSSSVAFICKYTLSARKECADRLPDCESTLLRYPDTCSKYPLYATHQCPFSCGICEPTSTPAQTCSTVPAANSKLQLVSPAGKTTVPRGAHVTFACLHGYELTQGKLDVVCGKGGTFIGKQTTCQDPNTIIQDSNDADLIPRSRLGSGDTTYTGLGSTLGITRYGVIKQWKFFSPQAGWTFFQVWRPNPAGGNFSLTLVGQNQVMTQGIGQETYAVPEADWISVLPGDRIGLWEGSIPRGLVPYDWCGYVRPEDSDVLWTAKGLPDFSTVVARDFSTETSCRVFSFKAVIYPNSTVPAYPQRVTGQVPLVSRGRVGGALHVFLSDSKLYHIPAYGVVSEWQFYVKHSGSAAFQVWRRRADLGVRKYEFIGENALNLTVDKPQYRTLAVLQDQRIAVKTGDVIAVLYDKTPLGVPYVTCNYKNYPDSTNTYWLEPMTPGKAVRDKIYSFGVTNQGSYICRTFSMRAIVTQNHTANAAECFDPTTKGRLYRGTKDFTLSMKPCLDWKKVTQCPHHAFNPSDFGAGLDKNYCRNPSDNQQMDRAWCYTDQQCNREYCDVCNDEKITDTASPCYNDVCSKTREEVLKLGCAATCQLKTPPAPSRTQTCGQASSILNATITPPPKQNTYKVGDTVTYKCDTGSETLTRTCLSQGQFSPAGYVCAASCADRHPDCRSVLMEHPAACTTKSAFADQLCRYSCGRCQPDDTAKCVISLHPDVELVSPRGAKSVARGAAARFACLKGYAMTKGALLLACGDQGKFIGELPVCMDPNTLVQDSSDVKLIARAHLLGGSTAYTSLGSTLGVTRYGVIKKWKFFSPQAGWTYFHVWRPNPAGGNFSFTLVGQNPVMTRGRGEETYDVPEFDWISVQPGDRIGLFEGFTPAGNVPYDLCDKAIRPQDSGVIWTRGAYSDFPTVVAREFEKSTSCRVFSFKAVFYPMNTVPAYPKLATSQVSVVRRNHGGGALNVFMSDSKLYHIPAYGAVSEWQFYVKNSGSAAFQVWRRRADLGVRKFEFIGENTLNLTVDKPQYRTLTVPQDQRIAVKTGDVIAVLYDKTPLGVAYSLCNANRFPESTNTYWLEPMTPGVAVRDKIYTFGYTGGSYICRTFSMRAIVTQNHTANAAECFDPASKGRLYRGTKDYTLSIKPCLDWKKVSKCPHHFFKPSDFGAGLDKNYCRNPGNQLDKPWCYTDEQCGREYCDVCNDEQVKDIAAACSSDVCRKTRDKVLAAGCAATCTLQPPSAPIRTQTCGQASSVPNATITPPQQQQTYEVGDTVTYKCDTGSETLTRTCLSQGQFSPAGYVCAAGCADRRTDCQSLLLELPEICTTHPAFANQLCRYSCGLCQPDATAKCVISLHPDVELVSPREAKSVARGAVARFACLKGYAVTKGALLLACGDQGKFIGELPVCKDPNTISQDSSDVKLIARAHLLSGSTAYTSLGSTLGITRYGVIKQWKFFSPQAGWTYFHVWRPNPAGGNFSFTLVGQNPVMTRGVGEETYDVPEYDWISVQPGDRIGLFEGFTPAGNVPYDWCDKAIRPHDSGVIWTRGSYSDFPTVVAREFDRSTSCRVFSFKAVFYPMNTVPAYPKLATSQVSVVRRNHGGGALNVFMSDSKLYHIPAYGVVSEWQFYVKNSGSAAFQVWRRRADLGVRKFEFIGENTLNLTVDKPQYRTLTVPQDQRIAVKTGDVIAVLYDKTPLGVAYSLCNANSFPESTNTYWLEPMTPGVAVRDKIYTFGYTGGSYICRTFSMRAIVTQNHTANAAECMDPASKGKLYRGTKDYTLSMKPCLDWKKLSQCPHHFFKPSDFGTGLDKNYCRNPGNHLDRPWCYTDEQCSREYCDLCNDEQVKDTAAACSSDVCKKTREQVLAAGCAATCTLQPPSAPIRTQTCGQVSSVPNATITPPQQQQTYKVGDTVTYKCDTGSETLTRTCLSQGQFSPAGYVCAASCADRRADCRSQLLELPDVCTTQPAFANQLCRYSCGLCQPDATTKCVINLHPDVVLVKPQGAKSVARGTVTRYACRKGYVVTKGTLVLACGFDGKFIGELPECTDPNTLVQDSSDVKLIARAKLTSGAYAYTSLGSTLGITRYGVIKQWKFFSPKAGWTFFQVWRPNPAGGNFSVTLVGQNQVKTRGVGEETYDVPEFDWISVQPGDHIGLLEDLTPRANVPYDWCDKAKRPEDFGVIWTHISYSDLSTSVARQFASETSCRVFSFKAVIYPARGLHGAVNVVQNTTVPAFHQLATSQVSVVWRNRVGAARHVFMSDSKLYHIPAYGAVSEWQFYVKNSGSAAFQVWRRRADLGVRKFEFIGENTLNLTVDKPQYRTLTVPQDQRIAVKTGDVIAVLYGATRLEVPLSLCNANNYPESTNTYWHDHMTPGVAVRDKIYTFGFSGGSYICRTISMRAIVTQNQTADAEECFDPDTKGRLYRGTADYTLSTKPCLDWKKLTNCPHHAFKPSDFGAGLDKNYCRNPGNQLDRPWCYTDEQCSREYCDVCNDVTVKDTFPACTIDVCKKTREQVIAAGCAATCTLKPPSAPIRTQTCGQASSILNATITAPQKQQTYKVGDTVTYKCDTGSETLTRTCLSQGQFSPAGYVCDDSCADRHADCRSVLLELPDVCTTQTAFADQLCRYSCGRCQPDATAKCDINLNPGVELVSPPGATSVARGTATRYACQNGFVVTKGSLFLACGDNGKFIGELPECTDPNTIVQDSNGVKLIARAKTIVRYAYTSLGSNLGITRNGVIKQWKFFSPQAGWTFFQVWRPNPAGGQFSFTLVGQNQIMTRGVGEETYDVPEADWISVQPGDRIGLWEGVSPRAGVPYDDCDKAKQPEDFGAIWTGISTPDFSTVVARLFSSATSCKTFSFKAVILPINTLPAARKRVTSQVPVVYRGSIGAGRNVYMNDALNYHIPIDGALSEWQFYVKKSGEGALQVWRPRADLGTRKYELIGQNKVSLTISAPGYHTLAVPLAERIAVKKGDIIAVLYDRNQLGVPYNLCDKNKNPESYNTYWYEYMTPDDAVMGNVYGFSYTGGSYLCRTFSIRAIVTPNAS